jgi:hypothetical protein
VERTLIRKSQWHNKALSSADELIGKGLVGLLEEVPEAVTMAAAKPESTQRMKLRRFFVLSRWRTRQIGSG